MTEKELAIMNKLRKEYNWWRWVQTFTILNQSCCVIWLITRIINGEFWVPWISIFSLIFWTIIGCRKKVYTEVFYSFEELYGIKND